MRYSTRAHSTPNNPVKLYKILALTLPVGIDALTKVISVSALTGRDIVLVENILSLRLVRNTGAAFSMLDSSGWVIYALTIALLAGIILFMRREKLSGAAAVSLCAVFSGGLSNLIDRLINGGVTDMISLDFISFPVFNFADICITLGVCVFAVSYLTQRSDG